MAGEEPSGDAEAAAETDVEGDVDRSGEPETSGEPEGRTGTGDATDDGDGSADDAGASDDGDEPADEPGPTDAGADESAASPAEREADRRGAIEGDVRSSLDAEVRDEDGVVQYDALRQVAASTEGVPGSGITKQSMYDAVVEARVAEALDEDGVGDTDAAGVDEAAPAADEGTEASETAERDEHAADLPATGAEAGDAGGGVAEAGETTGASVGEAEGESVPLTGDPDTAETGWPGGMGPDEDREMPLAEHIEEMLRRLAVVVAVAGLVSLLVLPFGERIINFLWYSILPGVETEIARPRLYSILELWFTRIKVASLAGLIVALPVLVYEAYAFMRPGLYPHERRYYLAAVPTSLVLALVGVSFAYFVVLPAIFVYFLYYSQDVATIGFALGRTFDLILLLMGYMALVFQIPLFLMLAMMMGLVTRRWLADRRILFWGAFLGISFVFSPDPTGMAPILVAATMIVLFEGTLLLTKWTGRD